MYKEKKKRKINKKLIVLVLAVFVLLIGAGAKMDEIEELKYNMRTIDINGTECRERQNVEVYLIMGIDVMSDALDEENPGNCDTMFLFVFDRNENTYGIVPIDRNTIMSVATLDEDGAEIAKEDMQVSLAHATGDGKEQSCSNVRDSIVKYFYGHEINGYMSYTMDSIKKLNHELGGVTVTVQDDLTSQDPELVQGTKVKLSDEQAVTFVRGRTGLKDDSNVNRVNRQVQYIEGCIQVILSKLKNNQEYIGEISNALRDDTVSDITDSQMRRLAEAMHEYEYTGVYEIDGRSEVDEWGFMAFYPDEDSKAEVARKLLYKEK